MDPIHSQTLEEIDRRTVFHPSTDLTAHANGLCESTIIISAEGIRIRDAKVREWIDAFASLWCMNIGYGRREIAEMLHRQTLETAYYHGHAGHSSEPAIRLTDSLLRMCPNGMGRIFWGLQGSDAHETQVKMIRYYNNVLGRPAKKKKLIARHRAYHGLTCMSASLLGVPKFHAGFDLPLPGVVHVSAPYCFRRTEGARDKRAFSAMLADELDFTIEREGPDTVAAFFAEPVMGVGGVIPSPAGFCETITPVLEKHDVLLVADEVVTGFGRMGTNFVSDFYDLEPDMMTISKWMTSGYFPLAGYVESERVWSVLTEGSSRDGPSAHGFTHAADPLGAAVAMTNLDIIEREGLTQNAAAMGIRLREGIANALGEDPMVGDVRGEGLLARGEFVAKREDRILFDPCLGIGARLARACRDEGLIVRPLPDGDIMGYLPPPTLFSEDVDEIIARTMRAVTRETDAIRAEGLVP